jgi:CBS domain-containing protein
MLAQLTECLQRYAPFQQMERQQVLELVRHATQHYYEPGEVVLAPIHGEVQSLLIVKQGRVIGEAAGGERTHELSAGDCFPIGALLAKRAVVSTYRAEDDTFVLQVPAQVVMTAIERSPVFADYAHRRVRNLLDLSRKQLLQSYAQQSLAEQSLETPLATLCRRAAVMCSPATPLQEALTLMHRQRIGSILICDEHACPVGILTRFDILCRITLPQVPLGAPISQVMSTPVHTLNASATAQDAALLMSKHGIRHVPVVDGGKAIGVISERDLFSLQRMTLKQVSTRLRDAGNVEELVAGAADIRRLARNLLAQGVQARQLTALVSHLNDVLTARLLELLAAKHQLQQHAFCWLAFGSEGRAEQTIATDQDNGLVFAPNGSGDEIEAERSRYLTFAREVNQALDACGYPLCKGNIMASNPECCLTREEWRAKFQTWVNEGTPEHLLAANIYFDLRPIWGNDTLVEGLRTEVLEQVSRSPRFLYLMTENALRCEPPLNWLGSIVTEEVQGVPTLDLKMHGTAPFVEAARIFSLAHGVHATNTSERLRAIGALMNLSDSEVISYIEAFEFLLMLRLRLQIEGLAPVASRDADAAAQPNPNRIVVSLLSELDQRILKETLRQARKLQQRLGLDFLKR